MRLLQLMSDSWQDMVPCTSLYTLSYISQEDGDGWDRDGIHLDIQIPSAPAQKFKPEGLTYNDIKRKRARTDYHPEKIKACITFSRYGRQGGS